MSSAQEKKALNSGVEENATWKHSLDLNRDAFLFLICYSPRWKKLGFHWVLQATIALTSQFRETLWGLCQKPNITITILPPGPVKIAEGYVWQQSLVSIDDWLFAKISRCYRPATSLIKCLCDSLIYLLDICPRWILR